MFLLSWGYVETCSLLQWLLSYVIFLIPYRLHEKNHFLTPELKILNTVAQKSHFWKVTHNQIVPLAIVGGVYSVLTGSYPWCSTCSLFGVPQHQVSLLLVITEADGLAQELRNSKSTNQNAFITLVKSFGLGRTLGLSLPITLKNFSLTFEWLNILLQPGNSQMEKDVAEGTTLQWLFCNRKMPVKLGTKQQWGVTETWRTGYQALITHSLWLYQISFCPQLSLL